MNPVVQPAANQPPPPAPPAAAAPPAVTPAPAPDALGAPVQTIVPPAAPPAAAAKPGEAPVAKPGEQPAAPPPALVDAKWRPPAAEGLKRDDAVMGKVAEKFAAAGLNTAQAEAMIALSDELAKSSAEAGTKAAQAAEAAQLKEQHAGWWKQLGEDKEIGGGSNEVLKANLVVANKAVDALFGDEGRKAIQEAGLTNWPPLVKAMLRAGGKIREDVLQDGNRAAPPIPTALQALQKQYPQSPELWDPTHPQFQGARK